MPNSGVVSRILETSKSGTSAIYRNAFLNPGGESWRGILEGNRKGKGGESKGESKGERKRESKRILFYDY